MGSNLNTALLLGGLATGGYLFYRSARSGAQQADVWTSIEAALSALLAGEASTTVPQPGTPGPSQTTGATTRKHAATNSLGDPYGTTYQVGDPHPTQDTLRVVATGNQGTTPIYSSLPQGVIDAFLRQFN